MAININSPWCNDSIHHLGWLVEEVREQKCYRRFVGCFRRWFGFVGCFRRWFDRSIVRSFVCYFISFLFLPNNNVYWSLVLYIIMEKSKKTFFSIISWHHLKLIKCWEEQKKKKRAARAMSNARAKVFPGLHLITSSAANLHFVSFPHEEDASRNGVDFGPKQL